MAPGGRPSEWPTRANVARPFGGIEQPRPSAAAVRAFRRLRERPGSPRGEPPHDEPTRRQPARCPTERPVFLATEAERLCPAASETPRRRLSLPIRIRRLFKRRCAPRRRLWSGARSASNAIGQDLAGRGRTALPAKRPALSAHWPTFFALAGASGAGPTLTSAPPQVVLPEEQPGPRHMVRRSSFLLVLLSWAPCPLRSPLSQSGPPIIAAAQPGEACAQNGNRTPALWRWRPRRLPV